MFIITYDIYTVDDFYTSDPITNANIQKYGTPFVTGSGYKKIENADEIEAFIWQLTQDPGDYLDDEDKWVSNIRIVEIQS